MHARGCTDDSSQTPPAGGIAAVAGYVLASLAGILTNSAWIDERAFPATWFGLTIWILLTMGLPPYLAFRYWLFGGLSGLAVAYYWLPSMAARHLEIGVLPAAQVALFAVMWDAFRFGVFGYLVSAARLRGRTSILAWPALWVALEWIWPHVFPWRLGHTQIGWLAICQIAEVCGVYGVSFLVMWGSACLAMLLRSCTGGTTHDDRQLRQFALCGITLLACVGWGCWRMRDVASITEVAPRLRVALVQAGSLTDAPATLCSLSAAIEPVDLIVWGESSVSGDAAPSTRGRTSIQRTETFGSQTVSPCPALDAPLLFGGFRLAPHVAEIGSHHNTAFLLDRDGHFRGHYHKRVLMPWGEDAAGQQWIPGLASLLGDRLPLVAGTSAAPLLLPTGQRVGVLICYEDLRADTVRETVRQGAELLVNINNLTSFGRTAAIFQHQQIARFRAIETRRALIRCGITGSTAVVSATGKVDQQATPQTPSILLADVPSIKTRTIYTRSGDAFAVSSLLIGVLILIQRNVRRYAFAILVEARDLAVFMCGVRNS